jgi:hypothetical protein
MSNREAAQKPPLGDEQREQLIAYLDGELNDDEAAEVLAEINRNPELRREAEALKKTWDLLDYLPRPPAPVAFTERTLTKLETAKAVFARRELWWRRLAYVGWAIAVVLAAVMGFLVAVYAGRSDLAPTTAVETHSPEMVPAVDAPAKVTPPPQGPGGRLLDRGELLRIQVNRVRMDLEPKLSVAERKRLRDAAKQPGLVYLDTLLELAKKHDVSLVPPNAERGDRPGGPRPAPARKDD